MTMQRPGRLEHRQADAKHLGVLLFGCMLVMSGVPVNALAQDATQAQSAEAEQAQVQPEGADGSEPADAAVASPDAPLPRERNRLMDEIDPGENADPSQGVGTPRLR